MAFEDKLIRKKLEIALADPSLVDEFLSVHGPKLDQKLILEFKAARARKSGGPGLAPASGKDEATFQIFVQCPLCKTKEIVSHELKARSLGITFDRFQVPRYEAVKGTKPINYTLFAVTVCPKCLFASPDKRDFNTFSVQTRTEVKSVLSNYAIEELKKKGDERRKMLPEGADTNSYFNHPRSVEAAMVSYKLALHRARIEIQFDAPLSNYKSGMYLLKMAMFTRDAGKDDIEFCQEAVKFLMASYTRNEMPKGDLECQLLYLILAISIRLGSLEQAQSYLGVLERMKSAPPVDKDGQPLKIQIIERWLEMSKSLWTDREDPDLWKH